MHHEAQHDELQLTEAEDSVPEDDGFKDEDWQEQMEVKRHTMISETHTEIVYEEYFVSYMIAL